MDGTARPVNDDLLPLLLRATSYAPVMTMPAVNHIHKTYGSLLRSAYTATGERMTIQRTRTVLWNDRTLTDY
jgi:hypothetical protein